MEKCNFCMVCPGAQRISPEDGEWFTRVRGDKAEQDVIPAWAPRQDSGSEATEPTGPV